MRRWYSKEIPPSVPAALTKETTAAPSEGGGVVPDEVHVVEVVETSAGVERDQVERIERDVAESHPGPQEEHVVAEDHDADEETSSQDESLSWMGVFGLHAKRSLREQRRDSQAMEEVVPGVFNNSTTKALSQEVWPGGGGGRGKPSDQTKIRGMESQSYGMLKNSVK
ncbi:hypothetical protein INR49_016918 [Caranx melampygus]|nr:hypothetical protein INR49_016918 [Caranx melampygus]